MQILRTISFYALCSVALFSGISQADGSQPLELSCTARHHEKINLLIMVVGEVTDVMAECVALLKKDLEFSGQFSVNVRARNSISSKSEMVSLNAKGFALALFINEAPNKKALEWRLYDTQEAEMLKGKKYVKRGELARGWAHNIADVLWPELTNQEGFFSTKIAYCKEAIGRKNCRLKHIYVADYDGSNEQPLVVSSTINVAPRFNANSQNPLVFYSQSTSSNIRLMRVDMHRKTKVASNFDGVNMLPSFSKDGSKLVYCASHGVGNCQLYFYDNTTLKQVTNNTGNNISPSLSDDGKLLFFCSDYQSGKPQIYCCNLTAGTHFPITAEHDMCYCPAYNSKKGLLAYSKMVKGTTQLFVYDQKDATHKQITFDEGSKDECAWSPCGNYLLFGIQKGRAGSIVMLNMMNHERRTISAKNDICSYPAWSPVYDQYPVIA